MSIELREQRDLMIPQDHSQTSMKFSLIFKHPWDTGGDMWYVTFTQTIEWTWAALIVKARNKAATRLWAASSRGRVRASGTMIYAPHDVRIFGHCNFSGVLSAVTQPATKLK